MWSFLVKFANWDGESVTVEIYDIPAGLNEEKAWDEVLRKVLPRSCRFSHVISIEYLDCKI